MKKLQKLFMAVAAVAGVTACTTDATEDLGVNLNEGPKTLTLSLDDTRTQLGEKADGTYPLTWAENDAISVNGSVSNPLTADEAGAASATFTFNNGFGSAPYFVAYPATSTNNQVVFAAEQTHTSNTTFGNGATVMYGYANDLSSVKLNHLTGVLKIGVVSGTEGPAFIKEVRISTVDRKPIAGTFSVDAEGKLTPVKTADVITYKSESDAGFLVLPVAENNPVTYIHVAVPAGVYGELYVTLESADGVMYKSVKTDSTKPLNAGNVREFSNNIAFVPVAETETFVIADYSDLYAFREAVEGGSTLNAVFVNDVEMPAAGDVNYPVWEPINAPSYTGTITGNGYAIKGLYAPLFNVTAASFKGLHLVANVEEKSNPNFGAFARRLVANGNAPKVEHCSVSGTIKIDSDVAPETEDVYADGATGGFVGVATNVEFDNCVNNATIELAQYSTTKNMQGVIGGIVGLSDGDVSFANCVNNGALKYSDETGKTNLNIGGIVAVCFGPSAVITFDNCTNIGNITKTAESASRNGWIGGIVSLISGETDGSTDDTRKTVTFNNNIVNKGSISTNGTIAALKVGGIWCETIYYVNLDFNGPVTNYGSISHAGTSTDASCIGGVMGRIIQGVTVNVNGNITNTESATITVSATLQSGTSYKNAAVGGIIGSLSHLDSSSPDYAARVKSNVYVNGVTVCNDAKITFSGKGYNIRIGGYEGYNYLRFTYLTDKAKVINNGQIEITEDAHASNSLAVGGLVGQINDGNIRGTAWTDAETGQIVNTGDIKVGGYAESMGVAGVVGRSEGGIDFTYIINTGDITVTATSNDGRKRIGGVAGRIATNTKYMQCQCFCNISVTTEGAEVGMLSGTPQGTTNLITFSPIAFGGSIQRPGETAATPLTEENYQTYAGPAAGKATLTDCSFLANKSEIVWGNFGI